MLYFTEDGGLSASTQETSDEFDRAYDQDAYEQKIAKLVRSLQASQSPKEREEWDEAVLELSDGDHYLLVLINGTSARSGGWSLGRLGDWLPTFDGSSSRKPGDRLRLIVVAWVLTLVGILLTMASLLGAIGQYCLCVIQITLCVASLTV